MRNSCALRTAGSWKYVNAQEQKQKQKKIKMKEEME